MLTPAEVDDFLHLRMPEDAVRETLLRLTPDKIDLDLLTMLLAGVRKTAVPVPAVEGNVMDCCGTGGSGMHHFNTSTSAAFVLAASGVRVVKFGNRAMSSASGSFDFLEQLGIPSEVPLARLPEFLDETGLVFLFAPQCYPALARFNAVRKALGVRTVFNFMGPLLNPIHPTHRVLGVSNSRMQGLLATILQQDASVRQAWVVRGEDTLDEVTCHGITSIHAVQGSDMRIETFSAAFNGTFPNPEEKLTPTDSVRIFMDLVSGRDHVSFYHRMLCLNAGAGFVVAGKADTLEVGADYAADLLANGKVKETLEHCRRTYAALAG